MVHQIIAIFVVLGLVVFTTTFLSKHGRAQVLSFRSRIIREGREEKRMRIVERIALSQHHSLHLVSIDRRMIVVAASPTACHVLTSSLVPPELPQPDMRDGSNEYFS